MPISYVYGASAPKKVLFEKFGFMVENVVTKAKELIKQIPPHPANLS